MKTMDEIKHSLRAYLTILDTEREKVILALVALEGQQTETPVISEVPAVKAVRRPKKTHQEIQAQKAEQYQKTRKAQKLALEEKKRIAGIGDNKSKYDREQLIEQVMEVVSNLEKPATAHEIEEELFDHFNNSIDIQRLNHLLGKLTKAGKMSYKRQGVKYVYWIPTVKV